MPKKSKEGPRNSFLGLRLPEKTKFGLTLLARSRHQAVPDVVISAIHALFTTEKIGLLLELDGHEHPVNALELVWAPRASDRLANLAFRVPALMSAPERTLWERVLADERFWSPPAKTSKKRAAAPGGHEESELLRDVLAAHWDEFSQGEATV
jgi:hypothetical protein